MRRRKKKLWKWDRQFEATTFDPAQVVIHRARQCLEASADEAGRSLVGLIERLARPEVPLDVRRQLAEQVAGALADLAARAQRFERMILAAVPRERPRAWE